MSEKMKGYVNYVGSKPFKGKNLWSFRVRDSDKWFRTGLVDPQIQKNDYVEFDFTEVNGNANVDVSSIVKRAASAAPVIVGGVGSLGGERSSQPNGKDTYWEDKAKADVERDKRIQYQSARKDAIATVDLLLREKALKLPEKLGAAYDVILGKIGDLTDEFFAASSSPKNVEAETVQEEDIAGKEAF